MRYSKIPDETIRRLPVYLRGLQYLLDQGRESVSSTCLAEFLHAGAAQIRKDFSYFGDFGTRGVGYNVETLIKQIRVILKLSKTSGAALVGAGNLGNALLAYPGFRTYGFKITAVFDNSPTRVGKKIGGVKVEDIAGIDDLKNRGIKLAIIAVPAEAAQKVADKLVIAGVNGILNFAPQFLTVPRKVKVITIDIAMELGRLPYYI
ncbi:MAG: redox-sensing transcriptional repressor Rex [Sedimentisphaerales bacterium]|nr:redox-sensing transcriptional repressor Rex [Sedimentisphaerales bacterium]